MTEFNQPLGGNDMPRFAGPATMMRLPSQATAKGLDVCFVGVPIDIGSSNRSGTRHGPRQIRAESCMIRPYNMATRAKPFESFQVADIGDVAISWENEAHLALREMQALKLEIVVPSVSILAEPPVAVDDKVVLRRGTRAVAQGYLEFLYTPEGQEIIAKNYYRPRDAAVAAKYAQEFANIELVDIGHFGGWKLAQQAHFGNGGIFDQITAK